MTFPAFEQHMGRLAGLKFKPASLQTHWEALKDLPDALLVAAVEYAQTATDEFPSPKQLKAYAEWQRAKAMPLEEEADRGVDLDEPVTVGVLPTGFVIVARREWKYYCEECRDSGMTSWWCGARVTRGHTTHDPRANAYPWMRACRCPRAHAHLPHEWVSVCACAEGNPHVKRRLERLAQGPRRGTPDRS